MAEGKKGFVLYCDLIHTVRKMPKDKAGELLMTILSYVNDENPAPADLMVDLVFEPIKQQLKRDLRDWENTKHERSESGKLGGVRSGETRRKQAEAKRSTASKNEANEAVTVKVTVIDTVTDIERESPEIKFDIEECLKISLKDPRWVRANKSTEPELSNFNDYLEKTGRYEYNPLDYKKYFAIIKGKYPELLKRKYTIDELKEIANQMTINDQKLKAI